VVTRGSDDATRGAGGTCGGVLRPPRDGMDAGPRKKQRDARPPPSATRRLWGPGSSTEDDRPPAPSPHVGTDDTQSEGTRGGAAPGLCLCPGGASRLETPRREEPEAHLEG